MTVKRYVVVVDAVSTETGKMLPNNKPEILRVLNGQMIESDDQDPKILQLLAFRSVVPESKYKPGMRVNPKIVTATLGAADDPVVAPDSDVIPLAAPAAAGANSLD